jgi:dCTP deaminase
MILSAQSIRRLCNPKMVEEDGYPGSLVPAHRPLITPFVERGVSNGKSYGLSACTYDVRIDHDLILTPGETALASTIERVCLPHNVCASVLDKSTYARLFITAFNTHFDPGFEGFATIELANVGSETVSYERGDPLCQFKFEWLDEATELPYKGKYNQQQRGPQGPRYE